MPIYTPGKVVLRQQYVPLDANYPNVSLLLHGDGPNGSTIFTDNSPAPKSVTAFGNAQISTAQSKFGGASIAFDGNGDYLTAPSGADFDFGSSSFTIELFVRFNSLTGAQVLVGRRATSAAVAPFFLYWDGSGISFLVSTNGTTFNVSSSGPASTVALNTWHHVAAVRHGSLFTCYVDGIAGATVSNSSSLMSTSSIIVIGGDTSGNYFNGYIDDLRITRAARYTANFTPPTQPFPNGVNG